jgi:hypothetical protein
MKLCDRIVYSAFVDRKPLGQISEYHLCNSSITM